MTLQQAYNAIKTSMPYTKVDSFRVIVRVEEYRQFWKPQKTNVILLAESHVYTTDEEYEAFCSKAKLDYFIKNYPINYVRFIYCLAYGESDLLSGPIDDNKGTLNTGKSLPHAFQEMKII